MLFAKGKKKIPSRVFHVPTLPFQQNNNIKEDELEKNWQAFTTHKKQQPTKKAIAFSPH